MGKLKIAAGIKKFFKILFFFLTGVFSLLILTYVALRSPYVQSRLVNYVTERIEHDTGVKIKIGGVNFKPMESLVLNDVLLKDFRSDTLLYCKDLSVKIDSFRFADKSFVVKEILLEQAYFNLFVMRGENGGIMNVEMFLDSLQGKQMGDKKPVKKEEGTGWLMGLEKVSIRDSRFAYRENERDTVEYGVDWTDVECHDFNVDVTEFHFGDEKSGMTVSGLRLIEKSGLEIKQLDGKVVFKSGNLAVTESKILLARSNVDLIKLEYNWTPGQRDWRNFVTKMQQYYEVGPSSVSFIDLAYFNETLRGINNTVKCSGIVSNTVDNIEGHDLHIEIGEKSVLQGRFKSSGLPDFRRTVFNIDLYNAHLNPEDLESVYLPWFNMNIPVPSPLYQLQYLDFENISFNGILSDFVVEAKSVTPSLRGNLKFIYTPTKTDPENSSDLSGDFDFSQVDCGKFSGVGMLGNGVVSGKYKGCWWNNGITFDVDSKLSVLGVNKGQIKDIGLFLTWANDRLNVVSTVKNEGIDANLTLFYESGRGDTTNFFKVKGHMDVSDLNRFGLSFIEKNESIHSVFDMLYTEKSGMNTFGNMTLSDFRYSNNKGVFEIPEISIEHRGGADYSSMNLNSDVADLYVNGNFRDIRPMDFVSKLFRSYLPAYSKNVSKKTEKFRLDNVDFQYGADIKDLNRVLKVVYPDLQISEGAKIYSHFRYGNDRINLTLLADTVRYQDFQLLESKIDLNGDINKLRMNYFAERVKYKDIYQLYNVRNELLLENNLVHNKLSWCNWERRTFSGELVVDFRFISDPKKERLTEIKVYPGVIILADSVWRVKQSNITINGNSINIDSFSIARNDQYLQIDGKISGNPEDKLSVSLNRFNLADAVRLALGERMNVFGEVTGNLVIQDFYKDRLFTSDFDISDWGINKDTLGSLQLRSFWDGGSQSLIIGAENRIAGTTPLVVNGYYKPDTDSLDIEILLSKVELNRLGNYTGEFISETGGGLSGTVNISGTSEHPDISGFVGLDSVAMKVNNLNTLFFINDKIHIADNILKFNDFKVRDVSGNLSVCNGQYHFGEDIFDINIKSDNFLLLNTDYSHNESFYGKAYISGFTNLNNLNGLTNILINARTESGSRLFVPLVSGVSEKAGNFLHFVNAGQPVRRRYQVSQGSNDINFEANLEVNDNLELQVIFDETVSDVLKSRGRGDIKITLDKEGSLNMFGEYKVSKGESNLLNKKFILTPGGSVSWSGSPYDAILNLSAVYNLKASLHDLLAATTGEGTDNGLISDRSKKIPVECVLNLSDNLSNPLIKFDINFPSLETQMKSYIQSLFSSQDEINKQVFSLLVLNKFYRTDNDVTNNFGEQAGMAGVTTLTEMMSSQLSKWLSQISNNVDVGLSYRMGDEITTDEIEVALSTQLLNDRVTLSANGNMDVGGVKNVASEKNSNASSIAGDFDLDVKLNKQGTLKLKAYSHTDEKIIYNNTEMIQGVGVSYQESFDTVRELVRKYFGFMRRKKS